MEVLDFFLSPQNYFYGAVVTLLLMAVAEKYCWWSYDTSWFFRTRPKEVLFATMCCLFWPITFFAYAFSFVLRVVGWVLNTNNNRRMW